jgi:hypothetical protein
LRVKGPRGSHHRIYVRARNRALKFQRKKYFRMVPLALAFRTPLTNAMRRTRNGIKTLPALFGITRHYSERFGTPRTTQNEERAIDMQSAADLNTLQAERAALLHADMAPRAALVVRLDRDVMRAVARCVSRGDDLDEVVNRALRAWLTKR